LKGCDEDYQTNNWTHYWVKSRIIIGMGLLILTHITWGGDMNMKHISQITGLYVCYYKNPVWAIFIAKMCNFLRESLKMNEAQYRIKLSERRIPNNTCTPSCMLISTWSHITIINLSFRYKKVSWFNKNLAMSIQTCTNT